MDKALGFAVGKDKVCCDCAYALANGMSHLFYEINDPITVDADAHCDSCGDAFRRDDAIRAGEAIRKKVAEWKAAREQYMKNRDYALEEEIRKDSEEWEYGIQEMARKESE